MFDFDPRDYDDVREDECWGFDRDRDDRDRDDPRDAFVDGLDLPRGFERELAEIDSIEPPQRSHFSST